MDTRDAIAKSLVSLGRLCQGIDGIPNLSGNDVGLVKSPLIISCLKCPCGCVMGSRPEKYSFCTSITNSIRFISGFLLFASNGQCSLTTKLTGGNVAQRNCRPSEAPCYVLVSCSVFFGLI